MFLTKSPLPKYSLFQWHFYILEITGGVQEVGTGSGVFPSKKYTYGLTPTTLLSAIYNIIASKPKLLN